MQLNIYNRSKAIIFAPDKKLFCIYLIDRI